MRDTHTHRERERERWGERERETFTHRERERERERGRETFIHREREREREGERHSYTRRERARATARDVSTETASLSGNRGGGAQLHIYMWAGSTHEYLISGLRREVGEREWQSEAVNHCYMGLILERETTPL